MIRFARPHVQILMQHHGWAAFALLVLVIFVTLPIAANIVDYGAEGWLWALFGLCQRLFVDARSATDEDGTAHLRWVRLGRTIGEAVEILSGLTGTETVVLSTEQPLVEGDRVVN